MRITNALALLLAMLILVSIGSFAVAESELESDSIDDQYFWINGKSPEEITGKFIYWSWDEGEFTAIKEGMVMQIYPNIEPEFVNVSYADYLMKVTISPSLRVQKCRMYWPWTWSMSENSMTLEFWMI